MRHGETELLAQMIATIQDPTDNGVGIESLSTQEEGGIFAIIHMPSGDKYAVTIQWIGDNES